MEFDIAVIVALSLVYAVTGCMDGIAGGGGLIAMPALLLAGIAPELALGTNKLVVLFGCVASMSAYARNGLVFWPLVRAGALPSLVAALVGARAILLFDSEGIGRIILFLLPLAVAATLLTKKDKDITELPALPLGMGAPLACAALGFYDGFFGPGSGSFYILTFYFVIGLGMLHASATNKVFGLMTVTAGLLVFAWHGKVLYLLGIPLGLANIAGNLLGAKLAMRIGPAVVRKVLLLSITLLFVSLIWKFYLS